MKAKHTRFQDAEWYSAPLDIIVGGAGGIGSWLCLLLARIGHNLYVFDFDSIEDHNIGGQWYKISQSGEEKTNALATNILDFTGERISPMGKYEKDSVATPIMFSGFDNMETRRTMFNNWCELDDKELYIDGRMLAESGMVFFVTPDRIDEYRETLFEDSEVKDQPCSFKATSHSAAQIAAIMTGGLNNYLVNKHYGMSVRDVPFKLEYHLQIFLYETTAVSEPEHNSHESEIT